ncbi:hypothetical protein BST61_g9941 [Cercospora zeina]
MYSRSVTAVSVRGSRARVDSAPNRGAVGDARNYANSYLQLAEFEDEDQEYGATTSTVNENRVARLEARLNRLREENFQAFAGGSRMSASEMRLRLQSLTEAAERLRDLKIMTGLAVRELRDSTPHAATPTEIPPLRSYSRSHEDDINLRSKIMSGDSAKELDTITVTTHPETSSMERKRK